METFETSHRSSPKLYEIKEDSVVSIPLCDLRRQLKASLRNLIVRHELSLKDIKALELQVGFYDLLNRKGSDQNEVLILATPFVLKEVSIHKLLAERCRSITHRLLFEPTCHCVMQAQSDGKE